MQAAEVVILDSTLPLAEGSTPPGRLAELLGARGISARLVSDRDLLAIGAEDRPRVLVLPNASSFPLRALPVLRAFLHSGGHMVALGGGALEHLYGEVAPGAWREMTTVSGSLIVDGEWRRSHPERCDVETVEQDGREVRTLRMRVPREDLDRATGDGPDPSAEWSCSAGPLEPGATYVLSALMRSEGVDGRHFAHFHWTYLRVEQQDSAGEALHSALLDFEHPYLTGSEPWRMMHYRFWTDPRAARFVVRIGIKGGACGTLWARDVQLRREEWATTAVGMVCDGLHVLPHQVGCFDPSFRLEDTHHLVTSAGQGITRARVDLRRDAKGYAAVASTGEEPPPDRIAVGHPETVRRVTPIIEALDRHGRPRGPLLSVAHNIGGHYAGSIWAFMAVENHDLVSEEPGVADAVGDIVRHMLRGAWLRRVSPGFACYRDGENVTVGVEAIISGGQVAGAALACEIHDRGGRSVWSGSMPVAPAAEKEPVRVDFSCGPLDTGSDLYAVSVSLLLDGTEADRMTAGFVAWKPGLLRRGRSITFRDNYFRLGDRPTLLCGTKGGVFWLDGHPSEDPLAWDAECRLLESHGLCVYGMVGLSQWVTLDQSPVTREWMLRRLDARLQVCHLHGIVPFIDLQFHPVAGVDREAEIAYARSVAERYRDLRCLFFYVTGDISIPLTDDPEMRRAFHALLERRYGNAAALSAAWGEPVDRIEDVHVDPMKAYWQRRRWGDVKAADLHELRTTFLHAWLDRQAAALRRVTAGEGTRLITAEFWSDQQLDQWNASTGLDFSAMGIGLGQRRYMHRYDAPMLCLADMRSVGQSITIGEFGTQVHPAFDRTGDSFSDDEGRLDRFAMVVHHAFGRGASMIAAWDAADLDYYVFPWGLLHADRRVVRPVLPAYRNYNLFFRQVRPAWVRPDTLLVLPDENRRSGNFHLVTEGLFNAARFLMECRVDFAVLNDGALTGLAAPPRAIVYPVPFCPDDRVIAQLRRLAEAGAHVYVSGDMSYDPARRRTRTARLEDLAGVRFVTERRPDIQPDPGAPIRVHRAGPGVARSYWGRPCIDVEPLDATVAWRGEDERPVAFTRPVGRGSVFFSTDPVELYSHPADTEQDVDRRAVYRDFLERAGATGHPVEASDDVQSFRLPQEGGGEALVFYCNRPEGGGPAAVRVGAGAGAVAFEIGACRGGALLFDARRSLYGWEGRGTLTVAGAAWCTAENDVLVYSGTGSSLHASDALVVLPLGAGALTLHRAMSAAGAGSAARLGEVVGGTWRDLGALPIERTGDEARLRWTGPDARDIVIVGSLSGLASAADRLATDLCR